jgi:hypothetical protein
LKSSDAHFFIQKRFVRVKQNHITPIRPRCCLACTWIRPTGRTESKLTHMATIVWKSVFEASDAQKTNSETILVWERRIKHLIPDLAPAKHLHACTWLWPTGRTMNRLIHVATIEPMRVYICFEASLETQKYSQRVVRMENNIYFRKRSLSLGIPRARWVSWSPVTVTIRMSKEYPWHECGSPRIWK